MLTSKRKEKLLKGRVQKQDGNRNLMYNTDTEETQKAWKTNMSIYIFIIKQLIEHKMKDQ